MAKSTVESFLDRVSFDESFADQLADLSDDPNALLEFARGEGFDIDPEEIRDGFLERYGSQLSEEQLAAVAGGLSRDAENGLIVGGVAAGMAVTVTASAAAAAA